MKQFKKIIALMFVVALSFCMLSCTKGDSDLNDCPNNEIEDNNENNGDKENNNDIGNEEHSHSYSKIKMKPTSTMRAYTINVCSCGDSFTDNISGYYKTLDSAKYEDLDFLFIGNSYTYYNELWTQFYNVCASNNIKLNVYEVTKGSAQLTLFSDRSNEYGAKVYEYLNKGMDIVFIQEQSNKPISNYNGFLSGANTLNNLVKSYKASSILYQTWGRKEGHDWLNTNKMSSFEMYEAIIDAYFKCGLAIDVPVSPVGLAFYDVYKNHSDSIELYNADKTHPSLAGTYLASLVHYASIYGLNPKNITYTAGLDLDTVNILKDAAYDAVFSDYK